MSRGDTTTDHNNIKQRTKEPRRGVGGQAA
jgi:hypothetical protein